MPSVAAVLGPRRIAGAGRLGWVDVKVLQPIAARSAKAGPRFLAERMDPPLKARDTRLTGREHASAPAFAVR